MILDNYYWIQIFSLLGLETAACVLAAAALRRFSSNPRWRRATGHAAMVAAGLLCIGELTGARPRLGGPREPRPPVVAVSHATPSAPRIAVSGNERPRNDVKTVRPVPEATWWPGILWAMGTLGLLARTAASRTCLWFWSRRSIPADSETHQCVARLAHRMGISRWAVGRWRHLTGPFAFGSWKPCIALPTDWATRFPSRQREAMLAHELAHLAGRDPLWVAIIETICAILWWNPLIWWLRRRIRDDSELVADTAASLVPDGREALATSLVSIGRDLALGRGLRVLGVGGTGFRSALARRVTALVEGTTEWSPSRPWHRSVAIVWATAGAFLILVIPLPGGAPPSILRLDPSATYPGARLANARGTEGAKASSPPPVPAMRGDSSGRQNRGADASNPAQDDLTLEVKVLQVIEGTAGELGLDWVFGSSASEDAAATREQPSGDLPLADSPDALHVRVDRSRVEGQGAILSEHQVSALLARLAGLGGIEIISTPAVTTTSGRMARLEVSNLRTIVTGVDTNNAAITYRTGTAGCGPAVEVTPVRAGDRWRIDVTGRLSEFLGYDEPGLDQRVEVVDSSGKVITGQFPLPRFRVREASGSGMLEPGETLALRGPAVDEVSKVRRGWFRRPGTQITRKRLYLLVHAR